MYYKSDILVVVVDAQQMDCNFFMAAIINKVSGCGRMPYNKIIACNPTNSDVFYEYFCNFYNYACGRQNK